MSARLEIYSKKLNGNYFKIEKDVICFNDDISFKLLQDCHHDYIDIQFSHVDVSYFDWFIYKILVIFFLLKQSLRKLINRKNFKIQLFQVYKLKH